MGCSPPDYALERELNELHYKLHESETKKHYRIYEKPVLDWRAMMCNKMAKVKTDDWGSRFVHTCKTPDGVVNCPNCRYEEDPDSWI